MIDTIKIKKAFKKIDGEWKPFRKSDIAKEEDIDGMVMETTSGNIFKINMKKQK